MALREWATTRQLHLLRSGRTELEDLHRLASNATRLVQTIVTDSLAGRVPGEANLASGLSQTETVVAVDAGTTLESVGLVLDEQVGENLEVDFGVVLGARLDVLLQKSPLVRLRDADLEEFGLSSETLHLAEGHLLTSFDRDRLDEKLGDRARVCVKGKGAGAVSALWRPLVESR